MGTVDEKITEKNYSQLYRPKRDVHMIKKDGTKEAFNVQKVIARLHDPECEVVYRELGIDTICPAVLSAKEIDKFLGALPVKEALP